MVDIAISVVGTIAGYTVAPIGRQFGYLFCYNGNIEKLKREVEELEAKRRVVEQKVEAANNNCQAIREDVKLWMSNVISEKEKVDTILGDTEKVGKGCLNEWCLNLKSRYWVSRKAAKKSQDLGLLLIRGENYNEVAGTQQPLAIVHDQTPIVGETQGDGILEAAALASDQIGGSSSGGLDSRVSIMKDIMEAVKDYNIRMIGIWGMGGVGKTTMVKEVERSAKLDKSMFDEVVMTTISKEPDMKKIQEDIAELLGLKLEEQNTSARANRLHCRLTQEGTNGKPKRILIILDDVWSKLNLEEVGIPYEDSVQNGCKIVLTSRLKNVCDQMKTNKTFFVEVLPEREAWSLFRKMTDYASSDLHGIAEDIVKECGGLPIAIANIANALVNKGEATWKDVLRQLKNSALEGEYAVAYKTLKVSYDFQKTKEIKDFFLLCCLFPEDFNISIDDLVRYGMGLRFFKNIDNLQDARDRALAHVETLMNSNLLLGGESEESVKMHDLVRDFALSMTSEGEHVFMVKFGNGLKAWPINDTYEYHTSISLQCDEMHELPVRLKWVNLKLLQLVCFSGRRTLQFPEEFYQGMGKLQVLVLRNMSIPSLPGSLQLLTNLRTLSLCRCGLQDNISMIGYLEKLEILSFAQSEIEELPGEIGKLSGLRLLDLTDCRNLRRIPSSVLSSLTHLEELYMRDTWSFRWAEEESNATNASFAELKKLTNLVCIHINISLEVLPIGLTFEKMQKFYLSIGDYSREFSVFQNTLEICVDESVVVEGIMNALCMRTENLYLEVKDLKNLPERVGLLKLKRLIVVRCDELVSIVNTTHQPAPFGNLREIELYECNKLKSIFSLSIAIGLSKLQSLKIWNCQMMEEIFSNSDGKNIEFPNLKKLYLEDLPNLVGFCKAVEKVEFPNLKELHLEALPNLVGFCKAAEKVELPQLENLYLENLPKLTSLYQETETVASPKHSLFNQQVPLPNLAKLGIWKMDHLTTIFPTTKIQRLQNLGTLSVRDCRSVEVVFDFQGLNINESHPLSQLEELIISELPKLTHVWKKGPHQIQGFQNLTTLTVESCDTLKHLFTPSVAKILVGLEKLQISSCMLFEAIVAEEEELGGEENEGNEEILFPQLTLLHLFRLPNLLAIAPKPYALNLSSVKELDVLGCGKGAEPWNRKIVSLDSFLDRWLDSDSEE